MCTQGQLLELWNIVPSELFPSVAKPIYLASGAISSLHSSTLLIALKQTPKLDESDDSFAASLDIVMV